MHTGRDAIEFDCEQFGGIETLGPQVSLSDTFTDSNCHHNIPQSGYYREVKIAVFVV